jgi:hypothetical protein
MGGNLTVQKRAKPCSYLYTRSGRYLPRACKRSAGGSRKRSGDVT